MDMNVDIDKKNLVIFPKTRINKKISTSGKAKIVEIPERRYREIFNELLSELDITYETYKKCKEYTSNMNEILNFLILLDDTGTYVDIVQEGYPNAKQYSGEKLKSNILSIMYELEMQESFIRLNLNPNISAIISAPAYSFYVSKIYEINEYFFESQSKVLLQHF